MGDRVQSNSATCIILKYVIYKILNFKNRTHVS